MKTICKIVLLPVALVTMLAFSIGVSATSSTSTIGFTEGALTLTDPSLTHMNFNFLTRELPFSIPAESDVEGEEYPYPSKKDGIDFYRLVITDARSDNEEWTLTAQMSTYTHTEQTDNAFDGMVLLGESEKTFTYETDNTNMNVRTDLHLISGANALPVITLSDKLYRDVYNVTWEPSEVSFKFAPSANVSELIGGTYQATITWTITADIENTTEQE